jgi:hypothetical protein
MLAGQSHGTSIIEARTISQNGHPENVTASNKIVNIVFVQPQQTAFKSISKPVLPKSPTLAGNRNAQHDNPNYAISACIAISK